jgi:hypothetical protein
VTAAPILLLKINRAEGRGRAVRFDPVQVLASHIFGMIDRREGYARRRGAPHSFLDRNWCSACLTTDTPYSILTRSHAIKRIIDARTRSNFSLLFVMPLLSMSSDLPTHLRRIRAKIVVRMHNCISPILFGNITPRKSDLRSVTAEEIVCSTRHTACEPLSRAACI